MSKITTSTTRFSQRLTSLRLGLALYVTFLLLGCSRSGTGLFSEGKVPVTVEKVSVEETKPILLLPASLAPANKITFQFPIDIKVKRVVAQLGEVVASGEVLFELDEMDLALKMAGLKAKREEKKSLLNKNSYFLEERDRLLTEGKIDKVQYDSLEMETQKVRAEVEALNAEVALMETQIQNSVVRASLNGVVSEIRLAPNTPFAAREPLLTLVQIDPIHVVFQLSALEVGGVSPGMPVEVRVEGFGGEGFATAILSVSPELDPAKHTAEVKVSLPNPSYRFKGGMQAQVTLTSQRQAKILSIPAQALLKEGNKEYVYVIRENKAWPARVFTSKNLNRPELIEIQEGLKEDDLVVTEGQDKLKAGAEVNLWR